MAHILCLLIHHSVQLPDTRDMINMTCKKGSKQRECFNIKDITNNLDQSVIQYLLFAHAFTGCDTTSTIYEFGKIAVFKKMHESNHLKNLAAEFYNNNKSHEDIGNTAIASLNIRIHQLVILLHNQERKNMMKWLCQIALT